MPATSNECSTHYVAASDSCQLCNAVLSAFMLQQYCDSSSEYLLTDVTTEAVPQLPRPTYQHKQKPRISRRTPHKI
jgi:hypothetical protein